LRRVIPIIEKTVRRIPTPISIDTTKSIVAQHAVDAGATIINDISALRTDPRIARIAAENDARLILMHMKGTPKNMQVSPSYTDLFGEILSFLDKAVTLAMATGVARSRIIIDPGIGFGKTMQHNLMIIKNLDRFKSLGLPILIGLSRKAFIRNIVKPRGMKDIDPLLPVVETGTQAAVAASVMNGADIVRVHDVAGTCATLKVICAIKDL
jgi:dihydropteroate synthase